MPSYQDGEPRENASLTEPLSFTFKVQSQPQTLPSPLSSTVSIHTHTIDLFRFFTNIFSDFFKLTFGLLFIILRVLIPMSQIGQENFAVIDHNIFAKGGA